MAVCRVVFQWLYDFSWRIFYHIHPVERETKRSTLLNVGTIYYILPTSAENRQFGTVVERLKLT